MVDYNSAYTGVQIDANLAKAATATQPGDLGTAAFTASTAYATAAQGALADTAVQPADDAADLGSGAATDGYVLTADGAGGAAWEAAAGGGGTPGGTDTQVQFNDGGAFGGDSGFTFDKTNNTLGLGGGTITASDPIIDMAQTWNNAAVVFTALKSNVTDTASAAGSLLMDLQVGGTSRFSVNKAGRLLIGTEGTATDPALCFGSYSTSGFNQGSSRFDFVVGAIERGSIGTMSGVSGFRVVAAGAYTFASSTRSYNDHDLALFRDAANTLAQRNGVNAQAFNLYNTYTDASNYERLGLRWSGNDAIIGIQVAGTGTFRQLHHIGATHRFYVGTAGATFAWNIENTGNLVAQTGVFVGLTEMTAPAAPAANGVRIYAEDNGSGKTRLMALFATGAAQQIAIEP